jgi:hypothetical protein
MKTFNSIFVFFLGILLLLSFACKKKNDRVITIDTDTIFVNDQVNVSIELDVKVKDEEWKILETNTIFSNVSSGTYQFPSKGLYTIQYSAKTRLGKKISTAKKVTVYALPGIIKNYWSGPNFAHGDISLWVKGTRYDGKYYEDSVFYERKYGIAFYEDCISVYEPEVFLKVPGGRYKCFIKYKYFDTQTIHVEWADSVFIDGNCESFNKE